MSDVGEEEGGEERGGERKEGARGKGELSSSLFRWKGSVKVGGHDSFPGE